MIDALPLFLLRDSVRTRLTRVRRDLAASKAAIDDADRLFASAQSGQLTDTSASLMQLRTAEAAAQSRRTQAEAALIAAVSTELSARAAELYALLQHDQQAAEFGTATTAFFNAIDQGQPAGSRTGTQGTSGSSDGADQTAPSGRTPSGSSTTNAQTGAGSAGKIGPAARGGTPPQQKK
jgi:hypothetical protein